MANYFDAGRLTREAELLLQIEPALRQAREDLNDPENEEIMRAFYQGQINAYEFVIAYISEESN